MTELGISRCAPEMFDCRKALGSDALFVGSEYMAFSVLDLLFYELGSRFRKMRLSSDTTTCLLQHGPSTIWPLRQLLPIVVAATAEQLPERIESLGVEISQAKLDGQLIVRRPARRDN